jgi:hypothetical protein
MYSVASLQDWLNLILTLHCACRLGYGVVWSGYRYQHFGGACCFHLQGGQSELFVSIYQSTWRHMPEY